MNKFLGGTIAALFGLAGPALAQQQLSISAGGTGGVYYPISGGIAEIINSHLDGYSAVAEVTGGTVENMSHLFAQDSDFAMGIADAVTQAGRGTGAFEGRQVPVRGVAAIYAAPMQIMVRDDSSIHALEDIRGTRFSVGAPGSGNEVNTRTVLGANGITFDDLGSLQRLNYNETADAMRDGVVDGGLWASTAPTSSIMSLAASVDVRMITLSSDEVAAIIAQDPAFSAFTLPAGLYPGMESEVQTVALSNALLTYAEQDEELVYEVTKALHENRDFLIGIHPAANDMTLQYAVDGLTVPLHPGALRYYEEVGVTIPDRLRP